MTSTTTKSEALHPEAGSTSCLFDDWFDPIEAALRDRVRGFIETMLETELDEVLARPRYGRRPADAEQGDDNAGIAGHRHGSRTRTLTGTFGASEIAVPRARLEAGDGKTVEWKSKALRAYQRRTKAADALIASVYLSGTNTRRVRRALSALFVRRRHRQGHRQPDLAQGEDGLGRLERPPACRRADRAPDP